MKIEDMRSKDYAELGKAFNQGIKDYFERKNNDNSRQKFAHLVKGGKA